MSDIASLAAANGLNQAAIPLIKESASPQTQGNAGPVTSTKETVSISSEAKELQGSEK